MLTTLRKCVSMLPAGWRWGWMMLPAFAVISGAVEAGAAAAIYGLVKVIGDPAAITQLPIASHLAPWLPTADPRHTVVAFTLVVALFLLAKNMVVMATQYARYRIAGESSAALACDLLRGYLLAPYPFHFRRNSADLIRNTTQSVNAVLAALDAGGAVLSEVVVGAGILAVLLAASPAPTLVVSLVLGALIALLLRGTRRLARRRGLIGHEIGRELLQTLQQALGGIKEVKALGREGYFYRTYAEKQRQLLAVGFLGVTLQALPPVLIETVFVCGASLVVIMLTLTGRVGGEGLPLLSLFAYAGLRVIPMANRLTWRLNEIRAAEPAVAALYEDQQLLAGLPLPEPDGSGAPLEFRRALVADRISYSYPEAERPALNDVSLTVAHGEALGFAGPTGAGKSTLVDVLIGLLPPTHGRVTVDGVDLAREAGRTWRRRVGYVPQSIFLLDDTLRRNIALGIPDAEIDEARLADAVRVAQLDEVLARLPEGLATTVGERGVRLSGGERQRIGIARALYHDPDVLVLDEATSALDHATEMALTRAIRELQGRRTVLLIAHRLTTVRSCDRIAVLADGRLVACASYDELVASTPEFRRLVSAADAPAATAAPPR
jgi:ABC-type multidrug transport system fused ATPase/permease subunit